VGVEVNLYALSSALEEGEMGGTCSTHEMRNAYNLVAKPEGKRRHMDIWKQEREQHMSQRIQTRSKMS
jgi:hypothetical protein